MIHHTTLDKTPPASHAERHKRADAAFRQSFPQPDETGAENLARVQREAAEYERHRQECEAMRLREVAAIPEVQALLALSDDEWDAELLTLARDAARDAAEPPRNNGSEPMGNRDRIRRNSVAHRTNGPPPPPPDELPLSLVVCAHEEVSR